MIKYMDKQCWEVESNGFKASQGDMYGAREKENVEKIE